jgi:hypothetical protein
MIPMRTRAVVEQEIEATRSALIAADEASAEQADDPEAWALGDILIEQLGTLWAECALLPHVPTQAGPTDIAIPKAR